MNPTVSFAKSRSTGEPATVDAQGRMQVRSTITALPRTRVIQVTPVNVLSECRSAVFDLSMTRFTIAPASAGCMPAPGGSRLKSWIP